MKYKLLIKIKGYGLIKLLAIISIIGIVIVVFAVALNLNRMNDRDASRAEDIAKIELALITYLKSSAVGYPASTGECLNSRSGVGAELKAAQALMSLPLDPLWPREAPTALADGVPNFGQENFCYYYFSDVSDQFKISFFLEANSHAGQAGINVIEQ